MPRTHSAGISQVNPDEIRIASISPGGTNVNEIRENSSDERAATGMILSLSIRSLNGRSRAHEHAVLTVDSRIVHDSEQRHGYINYW